jgi:hypothetical protein
MKRFLLAVFVVMALSGCGWFEKNVVATATGYSRLCIDGVTYYQFSSGAAVAYAPDGKVRACQ